MDLKEFKLTSSVEHTRHPWELARLEVIHALLQSLAPELLHKEVTVFDIGCGDIYLIQQLSKRLPRWKFYAVDTAFDEELLSVYDFALKGSNINVFNSLDAAYENMGNTPVDIVLLLDVIEHIEDDVGFLAGLTQNPHISADTRFLITVPAYQSLFCSHDVFLAHHRRYSSGRLTSNAREAGLAPIDTGYFFGSLVMPRVLQVAFEKILPRKKESTTGVGAWKSKGLLDELVKNTLLLDFRAGRYIRHKLGITMPGLSTYAFCKANEKRA